MIGTTTQRRTLEIELAAEERVSLDDMLPPAPGDPDHDTDRTRPVPAPPGVILGTLSGIDRNGRPLVDLHRSPRGQPVAARSTVVLAGNDIGRQIVVMFEGGDPAKPIVMGILQAPQAPPSAREPDAQQRDRASEATLDGERVVLTAQREIVLRCGDASIMLTKAGKIIIRGKYILSRSSGVNRVQGGSIQLN